MDNRSQSEVTDSVTYKGKDHTWRSTAGEGRDYFVWDHNYVPSPSDWDDIYDYNVDADYAYMVGSASHAASQAARNLWMVDSGCTDHISPFLDDFIHIGTVIKKAAVANGGIMEMYGPGQVLI